MYKFNFGSTSMVWRIFLCSEVLSSVPKMVAPFWHVMVEYLRQELVCPGPSNSLSHNGATESRESEPGATTSNRA